MREAFLSIQGASHQYPGSGWKLSPCFLEARAGEILGIIGPNGSGKSTLLKIAAGVLAPRQGRVLVAGKDISAMDHKARARSIGYLPQHVQTHLDYLVEEVAAMGRFPHLHGTGFLSARDRAVICQCLDDTDTAHCQGRRFSSLSGGEKQRVLLASVIAQEPEALLLDEPTSAMDIHHQVRFFSLLKKFAANGMAVAVVTHDLNLASMFSDRLVLMLAGCILQEGSPAGLLNQENLEKAYGKGMLIMAHPRGARPMILPSDGI